MDDEIEAFGKLPPHADHFPDIKQMVPTPSPDLEFVKAWLKQTRIRSWCRNRIVEAYSQGYDKQSDGFSLPWKRIPVLRYFLPNELAWDEIGKLHPVGVTHDFLYTSHVLNRPLADKFLEDSLEDLNHPIRALLWYRAVRLFGKWHW